MEKVSVGICLILIQALILASAPLAHAEENSRVPAAYTPADPNSNTPASTVKSDEQPNAEGEGKALDWSITYKADINRVMSGGSKTHNSYIENLDLKLNVDAEKAMSWKGASFFFYGLGNRGADNGNTPSAVIGDRQGVSNIETTSDGFRLYEAWYQQNLMDDRLSILFGLHDLNSEFYVTDTSALFLNPSMGIGRDLSQTGVNGPSIFPYTSLALRLKVQPTDRFYIQSAAFGAQSGDPDQPRGTHVRYSHSDGELMITEAGMTGTKERPAKYSIGHWSYSKGLTNSGLYFLVDQTLMENFSGFVRYGFANQNANENKDCLTAGLVYTGLIRSRAEDRLGVGITRVSPSSSFRDSSEASGTEIRHSETTYEVSYRIEAGHGVAVQPDYQYVQNPGFLRGGRPANVGAIRLEVGF